jgi:hypothetical protein
VAGIVNVIEVERTGRVITEWCCGHDSMLGQASTCSKGCRIMRLTIDDDLETPAGLNKALDVVKDCPVGRALLWSVMSCVGGSPWQKLNIAQGEGPDKIRARWAGFRMLWRNFEVVGKAVIAIDGILAMNGLPRAVTGKITKWNSSLNDVNLQKNCSWVCVWACYPF